MKRSRPKTYTSPGGCWVAGLDCHTVPPCKEALPRYESISACVSIKGSSGGFQDVGNIDTTGNIRAKRDGLACRTCPIGRS